MRRPLLTLLSLGYTLTVGLAVLLVLATLAAHLLEFRSADPWPAWLPKPAPGGAADHLRVDVHNGAYTLSQIQPLDADEAIKKQLNPLPENGYRNWGLAFVARNGVWNLLGADTAWSLPFKPLVAALAASGVALLFTLIRRLYRGWMTVTQRSRLCLHCGEAFEDPDTKSCDKCGAKRPVVTVSSSK